MESILSFLRSAFFLVILSIILIYLQFIAPIFYTDYFRPFDPTHLSALIYIISYAFLGFFVLPLIISLCILQKKPSELGLCLPDNSRQALLFVLISILLLAPIMYFLSKTPAFQRYYLLHNISLLRFLLINLVLMPIYYFAEEFFFRGFLFLNLWRKIKWNGLWITEVIFAVAHFAKPGLEILFAFPVGLFLNYLTLRTKSIYPAILVHYSLGMVNIISVNFQSYIS